MEDVGDCAGAKLNEPGVKLQLLPLNHAHLDLEVLDEHFNGFFVLCVERDDDVCVLHRRLDEIVIGRLDEAIVLGKHVHDSAASFRNVSLDYKRKVSNSSN